MKKIIENMLITIIAILIPIIAFLYWLAFGYSNHLANLVTLFNYTF